MGNTDRVIRLIIALIISLLVSAGLAKEMVLVIILYTIAAILIITSVLDYCPVYAIFGISTKKTQGLIQKNKKARYRSK